MKKSQTISSNSKEQTQSNKVFKNCKSLKIIEELPERETETIPSSKLLDTSLNQTFEEIIEDQPSPYTINLNKPKHQAKQKSQGSKTSPQTPINQNQTLHQKQNSLQKASAGISREQTKVVCRFRPMNEQEEQLQINKDCMIEFPYIDSVDLTKDGLKKSFTIDRIFPTESTQNDVFEYLGLQLISDILEGFNGTIFAYGQTGAGKTYTMMGYDINNQALMGIIPRTIQNIFDRIDTSEQDIEFTLRCSMLEIYKENLRDLINPESSDLKIKEAPLKGIYVGGLSELCVVSSEETFEVIKLGNLNRMVASTNMNQKSSRSHSLFIFQVMQKTETGSEKNGVLNLVDLAGSEKISKSKVQRDNLEETKKINLSLSALGNVIHALTSKAEHIPYRDSKLTRLLQDSLGGNYKTILIVACSPNQFDIEQTINTLEFAKRAKNIQNKPRKNIKRSPDYYIKIIQELKKELESLQAQQTQQKRKKSNCNFEITSFEQRLIEKNTHIESNEEQNIARLENLTNDIQSLTAENAELKENITKLEKNLEKQSLQQIEAENKLLKSQFQVEKVQNENNKLQQQISSLLLSQKQTDQVIDNMKNHMQIQEKQVAQSIHHKSEQLHQLGEISFHFLKNSEQSQEEWNAALNLDEVKFSINIEQLLERYDLIQTNEEQNDQQLSVMSFKHRCYLQEAHIFNMQLVHALCALN